MGIAVVSGSPLSSVTSSSPDFFGIMMSLTITSGWSRRATAMPSSPSWATRTSKPSISKLTSRSFRMTGSSSTTSTLLSGIAAIVATRPRRPGRDPCHPCPNRPSLSPLGTPGRGGQLMRSVRTRLGALAATLSLLGAAGGYVAVTSTTASADAFAVDSAADSGTGSLRDALAQAAASPGGDTITIQAGLATIVLTSGPLTYDSTDGIVIV